MLTRWTAGIVAALAGWCLAAWADDLTDAIVGVDPRSRLESGIGAAYGATYGPQPSDPVDETSDLSSYYHLRSSDQFRAGRPDALDLSNRSTNALDPDDPSLGKPHARPGVWYLDDLQP